MPGTLGLLGQASLGKCKRTGTFPCWSTKALCFFSWLRSFNQPPSFKGPTRRVPAGLGLSSALGTERRSKCLCPLSNPGLMASPYEGWDTMFYNLSHQKNHREQGDEIPLYPSLSNNYLLLGNLWKNINNCSSRLTKTHSLASHIQSRQLPVKV